MLSRDKLQKIRLIVIDVDGTLITSKGKIGKETKSLIKELKNKGIRFSLASGRLHSAVKSFAEELELEAPLITLDGTLIKNHPGDETIFKSTIKKRHVLRAINLADKLWLNIALCHDDAIYYTERNSLIPQLLEKFGAKYEEVIDYSEYLNGTLELVITGDYKNNVKYMLDKMSFPYVFGLNTSYYKSQTHKGIYYLEIRSKGTSKGDGLFRLLKYLNLKPCEAAVIGDWYNDKSLFHPKVLKIAMANAVSELKRKADFITKRDNNEDGVGEFLELVVKASS